MKAETAQGLAKRCYQLRYGIALRGVLKEAHWRVFHALSRGLPDAEVSIRTHVSELLLADRNRLVEEVRREFSRFVVEDYTLGLIVIKLTA